MGARVVLCNVRDAEGDVVVLVALMGRANPKDWVDSRRRALARVELKNGICLYMCISMLDVHGRPGKALMAV